jgi:hypothetical protein
MRTLIALLLVIALLAMGSATLVQAGGPDPAQAMSVQPGTITGGNYHLTNRAWHVSGSATGGDYTVDAPYQPELRGNGCCCTYLPCTMRNP